MLRKELKEDDRLKKTNIFDVQQYIEVAILWNDHHRVDQSSLYKSIAQISVSI